MRNDNNLSLNVSKEYKPSKPLKIFLISLYLYFIIIPLILILNLINNQNFNISDRSEPLTCITSLSINIISITIYILMFIFGLALRKSISTFLKKNNISKKEVMAKVRKWILFSFLVFLLFPIIKISSFVINALYNATGKPVIYLYPEKTMDVKVKLDFKGAIKATYPDYDYSIKGWEVEAHPDGQLINKKDNQEYSYLFWDGDIAKPLPLDMKNGFVVKGSDTKIFLQKILKQIGLTPKEYNEFIVYWYPMMMNNEYNFIHFVGKDYTDIAPLDISPRPDSVLRVFMVFKALEKPIDVKPQIFEPFERKGFTVVEWGGIESK